MSDEKRLFVVTYEVTSYAWASSESEAVDAAEGTLREASAWHCGSAYAVQRFHGIESGWEGNELVYGDDDDEQTLESRWPGGGFPSKEEREGDYRKRRQR